MKRSWKLMSTLGVLRRGRLISRVDNHIIWLEPFLKYNMGPFSWLYERMRPVTGKLFGIAGQPPARAWTSLVLQHSSHAAGGRMMYTSSPWPGSICLDIKVSRICFWTVLQRLLSIIAGTAQGLGCHLQREDSSTS